MRILIAEDDLASRTFMQKFLSGYGECDITIDGIEAVEAFIMALDSNEPYDLICLDVMMPKVDGIKALKAIRDIESVRHIDSSKRSKIIVATALANVEYIKSSLATRLEAYISKPIDILEMERVMRQIGAI
ncbi:response regulator [Clostridium magnum]|uniref:Stage 0 sporulation protein A homolog n=1 Tax=Clostridium magnum DSM 2767 TaxID=1121326 RepID=A0A161YNN7_9CLOT|nr:response regulator [Clostridium magnum]KZL92332.1 response regulator MprA [Clostridium magnum DSM 2767]SHH13061.1 two-component system, chemotaxis family, response regulator CheY [Clostridium magnum DSM 2767]